ncbi:MAG: DUF4390 domain-containing protein [Piscirickettsiaceae bacterium]|nr:DUF4390 domain-containing protein [Piscirickettsiaceae bacterium]
MLASATVKRLLLFSLLLLLSSAGYAANFKVQSAQIEKIGNGYTLNAKIKYLLTPRVNEALSNGVPITFKQDIELIHSIPILGRFWQWQDVIWSITLRYELRYHALSEQYVMQVLDTGHQRNFPSLESALTALGTINSLSLPPKHLTDIDGLILQIRSGLDLHALPTPMRPGALISTKWQLTSPWKAALWP